jgi:hypothetical protein
MNKLVLALKSRTFLTIVVMVAFNIMEVVSPNLSPDVRNLVNGILGLVATIFHVSPSQNYNAPQA